ncbi:profilin, required for normal timing of actin polymerization in response to thermal stress [Orbilia brochopaga]|uniref:Profilin n=1 Tax=Orbilia brochopaga TaxID=3140254 RepID=A0AAV9ULD9_9PEZI
MSWQAYIDTSLVGSGKIDKGAIFSAAGDSVWAASPDFAVTPDEIKYIVSQFAQTENSKLYQEGFHIAGTKYLCHLHTDRSIYGKKDKTGVAIVKTKQAIVIAHYPDGIQTAQATTVAESLADYLIKTGY